MPSYSRNEVVLVRVVFSDQTGSKIRPAVVVSAPNASRDLFAVPLTSKTAGFLPGEFALSDWKSAGLNVATAVKRGIYTIDSSIVLQSIGSLVRSDAQQLEAALRTWL